MKTVMQIDAKQIKEMELTISVTMTVRDWRDLQGQIAKSGYPSWAFGTAIDSALRKMDAATNCVYEERI